MTENVSLALSELRSLITKAARGAGLSWGLAEEAGWAAEWLSRRGMPAADWATLWLAARLEGDVTPVEIGASLADEFASDPAMQDIALPDGLVAPGYLLPFLHRIAQAGTPVSIASPLGQVALVSVAGDVAFGPSWQLKSDRWRMTPTTSAEIGFGRASRSSVSGSVLECLDGLALWTTVPQSETSRRDAGSTGGDND
jgi:hypothetical protein